MKTYQFRTSCVNANGVAIQKMVDAAREITYKTFAKHCAGLAEFSDNIGYNKTLNLQNDWAVRFYKSKFQGKPCYFLTHSSIEYVWTN
jgi:hypothetical protein